MANVASYRKPATFQIPLALCTQTTKLADSKLMCCLENMAWLFMQIVSRRFAWNDKPYFQRKYDLFSNFNMSSASQKVMR